MWGVQGRSVQLYRPAKAKQQRLSLFYWWKVKGETKLLDEFSSVWTGNKLTFLCFHQVAAVCPSELNFVFYKPTTSSKEVKGQTKQAVSHETFKCDAGEQDGGFYWDWMTGDQKNICVHICWYPRSLVTHGPWMHHLPTLNRKHPRSSHGR